VQVGDLVTHNDMPKEHRAIGIVVRTYVDIDYCQVAWLDMNGEHFNHCSDSLEVISERR